MRIKIALVSRCEIIINNPVTIPSLDQKTNSFQLLYCGSESLDWGTAIRGILRAGFGIPDWPQFRDRVVMPTFLGRTAVWQLCRIWKLGSGDEILMPAYNCGTEVDPFLVSGCKVTLYRVDKNAKIDVLDIIRRRSDRTKVVYVTHYFGWSQNLDELLPWCRRHGLRLVEDCALALFSNSNEGPLGTVGDAAIFSLGKFLPVPAGGLLTLRSANGLNIPSLEHWPVKESLLRAFILFRKDLQRKLEVLGLYTPLRRLKIRKAVRNVSRDSTTLAGIEPVRPDMPKDYYLDPRLKNKEMPPISIGIFNSIGSTVVNRRRANYLELQSRIEHIKTLAPLFVHLHKGTCPMAFPVLSPKRRELVRMLESHGVCAYPFWEGYHRNLDWTDFPEARMLKDNLLTLPVNQSLSTAHMRFISRLLSDAEVKANCRNESDMDSLLRRWQ